MQVYSIFNNINSQLPLSVSILELDNTDDLAKSDTISAATHFEILKRYHFYFPIEKVGDIVPIPDYNPAVNYANYNIDKISLADFKQIKATDYEAIVAEKLQEWTTVYGAIDKAELDWFIGITKRQIQMIAAKYTDCYYFDWPVLTPHEKRHLHFTLYEFFLSFIFYGNRDNGNVVGYVLLAYA